MFNKYFKNTDISTNIKIRLRISYAITSPEGDEELSDDPYENWLNFINRDGGVMSSLIADILEAQIPTLSRPTSMYWNSSYYPDQQGGYIEIHVESLGVPQPQVTKCRTAGCPYSNYFGVCRNCEDNPLAQPDQKALDEHLKLYSRFVEQIKTVERLPFLTLNHVRTVKGYIPDVGEIEAQVSPF